MEWHGRSTQEIDRSEELRYDYRLHGWLLVASGRSCTAVSQVFGEDATTAQRWVRRFEHRSFAGLRDGEPREAQVTGRAAVDTSGA